MATDVDFLQFVLDQLAGTPGITHRRMFGEYALYRHGKVVAFLCDNQCFLKPTEAAGTRLDIDWKMDYLDTATATAMASAAWPKWTRRSPRRD